jgi:hypothetical protein
VTIFCAVINVNTVEVRSPISVIIATGTAIFTFKVLKFNNFMISPHYYS